MIQCAGMRISVTDQYRLAGNVTRVLTEIQGIDSVELQGSLAGDGADRFSDIDLIVVSDTLCDLLVVDRVSEKLRACFPILFRRQRLR